MDDDAQPPGDEDEPTPIGEAIFGFINELFTNAAAAANDAAKSLADDLDEAVEDDVPLEDAFEAGRDALAGALGELGQTLEQLSESAAEAAAGASERLAGLAAAIAGSGSVKDAIDRVVAQVGEPDADSPDWVRQVHDAIASALRGEAPDAPAGEDDGDGMPSPEDFKVPDYPPLDDED